MDKRDFYRELMEQYTFDKDKIYLNAKKGKTPWNRLHKQPIPIYLGMTAAVAAVVVTVGTVTVANIGRANVTALVSGNSVAELNDDRLKKGQNDVRDNEGSNELFDVLVSFERPLSSAEVQRVLLARSEGSVPISALYLADGTAVVGKNEITNVIEGNGSGITGAKIRCAGYLMSGLQNDSLVLAVEIVSDSDSEPITPIITNVTGGEEISSTDSGSQSELSAAESSSVSIDSSFDSVPDNENSTGGIGGTYGTNSTSSTNSISSLGSTSGESSSTESFGSTESSVLGDPVPDFAETHIYGADEVYSPAIGDGTVNDNMSVPLDVQFNLGDASLPFNPVNFSYQTENINAKRAYFLNDDTLYARTENDIRLYKVDGSAVNLTASMECPETKVFWIAENGGRLLALGQDGKLYDVSADNGTINAYSLNVNGTICEIAYNEDTDILALNVLENGVYSLRIYKGGFEAVNSSTLYSSAKPFNLIAAANNFGGEAEIFFAAYSDNGEDLLIYDASYNGEPLVISTIQGGYEITRNTAFSHAVLHNSLMTMIYDPSTYGLINVSDQNIQFGVSKHSFYSEGSYYTIANGGKSLSGGIPVIAKFDFMRSFSKNYMAAAENGAVRIVSGIYTDRARNDYLSFEIPAENASDDMRMAVNAAVGIQNALAERLCADYGITERTKAVDLISVCFTETAAENLKKRCAIDETKTEGETFEYSSGQLYPVNLSDSVLVISDETETGAVGTLYVNAGSFGGKRAYYSCAVKLLKTENGYKADAIIE